MIKLKIKIQIEFFCHYQFEYFNYDNSVDYISILFLIIFNIINRQKLLKKN